MLCPYLWNAAMPPSLPHESEKQQNKWGRNGIRHEQVIRYAKFCTSAE
jgi:hypothetical protein